MSSTNQLDAEAYLVLTPRFGNYAYNRDQVQSFRISKVTTKLPGKLLRGEIAVRITMRLPEGAFQPPKLNAVLDVSPDHIITGEPLEITVEDPQ